MTVTSLDLPDLDAKPGGDAQAAVVPLRIGLLLDSPQALHHLYQLVLWARKQPGLAITHLIVHAPVQGGTPPWDRLLAAMLRGLMRAEGTVLRNTYRGHLTRHDLARSIPERLDIAAPMPGANGHIQFDAAAVDQVRALGLDLLLGFGPATVDARMAAAARIGTLWMRYGRGGVAPAAGFDECRHAEPATGFAIERIDGTRRVLRAGRVGTRVSYLENQAHLYRKADVHLRALLTGIATTGTLPSPAGAPVPGLARPRARDLVGYAGRLFKRAAIKGTQRALRMRRKFGISILQGSWRNADLRQAVEVTAPRGRFWADPFLWTGPDGRVVCFVEDYRYATGRAHISALEIIGHRAVDIGAVIVEPYHMSFPYLFSYEGALYMCPECSGSGQIRVYRCAEFPLKWELAAVLMDNVSAADTVLFPRDGKWWMLTSMDPADVKDHCSELYLFSGPSPLGTDWTPCAANPVRIDPAGGRNAGLIMDGGRIYRLAQRQGFDRYGEGLIVNEVLAVSDEAYREREVRRIDPDFGRRLIGSHHMTSTGTVTVVDHVRREFVF